VSNPTVSIRIAEPHDVDRLIAVSAAARGIAASDPRDAITDARRLVVVASVEGEIVGWAKTHHYDDDADRALAGEYLGGVNVVPEFRRRGIGAFVTELKETPAIQQLLLPKNLFATTRQPSERRFRSCAKPVRRRRR
jgi:GNAT superfamily N-acetyltransferase